MEAQFWLGNLYSLGQGVKQSYVDAHQWYTKSAIQGYKKALRRIHNLYQQDKKMHSHGKLNAKEDLKKVPRFLGEEQKYYYRELYEQRLDEEKQKLSNTINHFSQSFQEYKSLDQNDPVVQVDLAFLYQHGYGTIENVGLAIEYYTKASTQGHHDAQYNLGYIYQQNTNLKFHYRLALRWLRTSATNGNIAAQNSLAYYYEKGLATEIDYGGAIYWYTKAAVAGNSDAQLTLGKWYRKGEYVQKDLSEAVKWYKLAAQHGNGAAQNCLTQLNEDGIYQHVPNTSTKKTPRSKLQNDLTKLNSVGYFQALQKLCHHARMSDGNAMYQIGLKYYNGKDFTQDKDIALYWIKNAAKAGIQNAEKKIAQMYEEGDATDQDYHESSKWFKKGAAKKNDGAQSKLGTLFKNGLGVRRDPLEASKWFTLSAKQGNSDALCQLGLLLSKGEGLRWDGRKATVHFRQSALSGNPDALFQLGQIYENIHDSDDDFIALYNIRSEYLNFQRTQDVAIRLYRYSAKLGNNDAQNKLGQLYEKGTIVPLNFQQAEEYYTMASDSDNPIHKVNLAKKYLDRIFPCGDYIKIFHLIKHAAEQKHYDATRLFQTPITLGETFFDLTKVIDMFKEVSQKSIENLEYNIGYAYEHGIASHSKLNSVPVDYVSAIEWYSVGAEKGDSRAQFRLGMMYDEGKGVEQNRSIAFSCYSQAHGNGNSDATYTLAQMYLNGYGVEQDLVKAYHLFSHTSSMGHKGATQILYPSNSK
jgi:TPR repeat protein